MPGQQASWWLAVGRCRAAPRQPRGRLGGALACERGNMHAARGAAHRYRQRQLAARWCPRSLCIRSTCAAGSHRDFVTCDGVRQQAVSLKPGLGPHGFGTRFGCRMAAVGDGVRGVRPDQYDLGHAAASVMGSLMDAYTVEPERFSWERRCAGRLAGWDQVGTVLVRGHGSCGIGHTVVADRPGSR